MSKTCQICDRILPPAPHMTFADHTFLLHIIVHEEHGREGAFICAGMRIVVYAA